MTFATQLFGYNKKEVDECFDRLNNTIDTLQQNVDYLSRRCETLEAQTKKSKQNLQKDEVVQVDQSVALSIKKTLEENNSYERFV